MSKNHSLTENTAIRACPDKRFCFFSAIKRSRKIRNERQKAHLFHTRKIFQPKNQRLRLKDFAGCIKFTLCSTTPPCASFAIASPSLSGICRTNRPICDFEGLRANGTPPHQRLSGPHKQAGNCQTKKPRHRSAEAECENKQLSDIKNFKSDEESRCVSLYLAELH